MKTEISSNAPVRPTTPMARARWMVVDDDDGVRDFIASVLEMRGIAEVVQFHCAREALAAFQAAPEQFQFVVTDLEMPGMNGIEFCRRLRSVVPTVKVALATGNAAANEAGARQSGFCGLLSKPFPAAEIWRIIETAGILPNSIPARI